MILPSDHYNQLHFYYDCVSSHSAELIVIRYARDFWTFDNSAHECSILFDKKTFTLGELRIPALRFDQGTLYESIRAMDPFSRKALRIYNPDGELNTSIYHIDNKNEIFLPGEFLKYSPDDPMWYHYSGPVFLPEHIQIESLIATTETKHKYRDSSKNQLLTSQSNLVSYTQLYRQVSSLLDYTSLDSCLSMAIAYRTLKATLMEVEKDSQNVPGQMAMF